MDTPSQYWPDSILSGTIEIVPDVLAGELEKLGIWCHNVSAEHGFDDTDDLRSLLLMHAEISEAVEAVREEEMPQSEKIKGFNMVEEEMADLVIRCFGYCAAKGYDLGAAIISKEIYNDGRPHKHGKKF